MSVKEKATAPVSSVGADGKQPLCKANKESIADLPDKGNLQATNNRGCGTEVWTEKRDRIDGLETVSMTELYDTVYPPKIPIVDGLIYAGTYLFVGAPKVGKSFFMAQLGYHVSMGLDLWDYPVRKGTVLYLALEDDYARLQKRLSRMFGMESSENFYFATQSKTLNEGLEEQLNQFVKEHTDARLIIIDTLQKVREVGGDKFSYASDYEIVTKLKAFSDEHGICLLVVHHTRKMESSDSFDMISGTNGLLGAADGAFVMQKETATLKSAVLDGKNVTLIHLSLWNNCATSSKLSGFIQYLFFSAYMLPGFIIKHVPCCNLLHWIIKQLSLRKDKMDMIICLAFVMVQGSDTLHIVILFKVFREQFQQLVRLIIHKTFRQCNDQFSCFNALAFRSAFLKLLLIALGKFRPKFTVSCFINCVQIFLPCVTRDIVNSSF